MPPKTLTMARHFTATVSRLGCLLTLAGWITAPPVNAAVTSTPNDNKNHTALDRAIDKAAGEYFSNRCHVGLSIAVVNAGHTSFYDYGSTSREHLALPTPQSIYELASVTKTFTASVAARAVVDRRMTLDGDFRDYLSGSYQNLAWHGQPITLRTLLTHYSGMPRDIPDSDALFANKSAPDFNARMFALNQGFTHDQFISMLHDTSLRSKPGDKQAYSNAGYLLIGMGLEKVYGESIATLMREYIFQPLNMMSTGFTLSPTEQARLVEAYDRFGRRAPNHPDNAGAAWGLYASTGDMAHYVAWQLDADNPVIRASHQVLEGNANDGDAMAWNLGEDHGQPVMWHGGGSFGMSSQVVLYPTQHQGYVLLANDACDGTEGALKALAGSVQNAEKP